MNSMIYYPGFEVENKTWLKFSLLYFDELRPIIPYICADKSEYLSATAIRIMDETNLLRPYRPVSIEGDCASVIACEEFQNFLEHPELYSSCFGYRSKFNVREKWQNPKYQNCKLYKDKFSDTFYGFCIDNKIAYPFDNGIMISKDLAFAYMSFLADIISKNNEAEMVTDISRYNTFLLKNDNNLANSQSSKFKIAKTNIEFSVPINISDIPIEKLINLRRQQSFDECRRAYVHEINNLVKARIDKSPDYSLEKLLSLKKDLIHICSSTLNIVASVAITVSYFKSLQNGNANITTCLASTYSNAYSLKSLCESKNFFANLKSKIQAGRYLATIKRL